MATAKDVQDLLRLLTSGSGRNKLSLPLAMARVKALQAVDLRSISSIASADLTMLSSAIGDEKSAKSLQASCKAQLKDPTGSSKKRGAGGSSDAPSPVAKRQRSSAYELATEPQTPKQFEASLALPQPSSDEEAIARTTIYTNRAPLVLAFAVQLLRYTMPEQPGSSRLSLAQAVVSANSNSKARSLGIKPGGSAEADGWGAGQPKVRVMGREVYVLKRGGYEWRDEGEEEEVEEGQKVKKEDNEVGGEKVIVKEEEETKLQIREIEPEKWTVSASITSKKSTFVARAITISSPAQARTALQDLLAQNQQLQTASHNISAWRTIDSSTGRIQSGSNDDGESGAGNHILNLLHSSDLSNILVVVSRWYGGIFLGPDRWRIMTQVSRDALSQRLRVAGIIGQEALWGLDIESTSNSNHDTVMTTGNGTGAGLPIHQPSSARAYILKAFATSPNSSSSSSSATTTTTKKKKSGAALDREKEENLSLLLGALDLLFASWVEHVSAQELDRLAWSWYVAVRPDVESGVAGWGGKGDVRLGDILGLRRKG